LFRPSETRGLRETGEDSWRPCVRASKVSVVTTVMTHPSGTPSPGFRRSSSLCACSPARPARAGHWWRPGRVRPLELLGAAVGDKAELLDVILGGVAQNGFLEQILGVAFLSGFSLLPHLRQGFRIQGDVFFLQN